MCVADRTSTPLLIALTILVFILLYGPLMVPTAPKARAAT